MVGECDSSLRLQLRRSWRVMEIQQTDKHQRLRDILQEFPMDSTIYAFAYGSGVFMQRHRELGKMVDLIFVVQDPIEWHRQNLQKNWEHYSNLRLLGPHSITALQEKLGCGIYYNTYAEINNMVVKYGVISLKAFDSDLTNWRFIYVAGRLHKPVVSLKEPSDENNNYISTLLTRNRLSALRVALLQLPEVFTTEELYLAITELSYLGDCRMRVAENPNKVPNIVLPLMKEYDEIYLKLVDSLGDLVQIKRDGILCQKTDQASRLVLLRELPNTVKQNLVAALKKFETAGVRCAELSGIIPIEYDIDEIESTLLELAECSNISTIIRNAIRHIVMIASLRQTLTGFFSTGLLNSIYYAYDKYVNSNVQSATKTTSVADTKSL